MSIKEKTNNLFTTDIDLMGIIKEFWSQRKLVIKVVLIFLLLGLINHYFTPNEWKVKSELLPEINEGMNIDPSLGGVAAIAGINLDQGGNSLNPELYTNITRSTPFLLDLAEQSFYIPSVGKEMRLIDYIDEYHRLTPMKSIIALPKKMVSLFRSKGGENNSIESEFISLSSSEDDNLAIINSLVEVYLDKGSGTVIVDSRFQDKVVAAEINRFVVDYIKVYVTEYLRSKESQRLDFLNDQIRKRQVSYDSAQRALDTYLDSNVIITSEKAKTEIRKRQMNRDLIYNLYNSLLQKRQESELKIQEETPVFHVIEPYKIPSKKHAPRLKWTFLFSVLLGLITSVSIISVNMMMLPVDKGASQ
jgi:uncharacterized protein involved in exopolysaccharide biosynthesis